MATGSGVSLTMATTTYFVHDLQEVRGPSIASALHNLWTAVSAEGAFVLAEPLFFQERAVPRYAHTREVSELWFLQNIMYYDCT